MCRILNKLTPEKFDKLSLELLNVGIDNPVILKGVILLVSTGTVVMCVLACACGQLELLLLSKMFDCCNCMSSAKQSFSDIVRSYPCLQTLVQVKILAPLYHLVTPVLKH